MGRAVAVGLPIAALLVVMGRELASDPRLPLLAAGLVLYVGLVAFDLSLVPLLSLPILLVTARVSVGGTGLTLSDAMLAMAFVPSLLVALGGVTPLMRRAMWLCVGYQVATLFTVIRNPYQANVVEWFHAGLLVGGAIVVGWAVGRRGRGAAGLLLLALGAIALALLTLATAARHYASGNFAPVEFAWPYPVQKNAIGTVFALMAVVLYARPVWAGWKRGWALAGFWLLVLALLTTQSRQGIIAMTIAVSVLVLRRTKTRRRSKGILLAVIPLVVGVTVMVQDQIRSGNQFNSFFQRVTWFQDSLNIWGTDPWFGVGLRWWYTDRFPAQFQPPNAEMDTATSSGIIGLVAFLALLVGTWLVARRLDPVYGIAAELVLLARFVQSQLDLFWVSVQVSLPFLVLGICLGAAAHHEAEVAQRTRAREEIERATHPVGVVA